MQNEHATMFVRIVSSTGVPLCQMSRTCLDPNADSLLVDKALMFDDAARRELDKRKGRMFICDLVPRWKRPFLRLLGIRIHRG
jgi:hypothetical protein